MNDPKTTRTDADATDSDTTPQRTLSELLPLVALRLKQLGVVEVWARYERDQFVFVFANNLEEPASPLTCAQLALEIRPVLKSILERRYPNATKCEGASGYFEWNLKEDTLLHEHVITHRGI